MGCYNSTVVNASADRVWEKLRNFHDMSWAEGVIESCEAVGDKAATQVGAKRILNNAFHETLVGIDEQQRVLRYTIDDGPDAVSKDNVQGYVGDVRVYPNTSDNNCFVLWTSSWESSGGGVAEFCDPIYQALLEALRKHFA